MLNKNIINNMAKEVKKVNENNKSYNSDELKKATINDLEKLIISVGTGNYTNMKYTKLYNNLSGGYCIAQEIIFNNNIIEPESIYQYENKYYYKVDPEDVLEGEELKKYYINKAYNYIFEVVKVDADIKEHISKVVENIETVLYNKESNLYWNKIIKDIKEEFKMDNNVFVKKVENMNGKKVTKKELNKIIESINYSL